MGVAEKIEFSLVDWQDRGVRGDPVEHNRPFLEEIFQILLITFQLFFEARGVCRRHG
jgi:hypothetical protein